MRAKILIGWDSISIVPIDEVGETLVHSQILLRATPLDCAGGNRSGYFMRVFGGGQSDGINGTGKKFRLRRSVSRMSGERHGRHPQEKGRGSLYRRAMKFAPVVEIER